MQNISQERNSPDLGQDKWECKIHEEEGREDKHCKAWLWEAPEVAREARSSFLPWARAAALEEEFAGGN